MARPPKGNNPDGIVSGGVNDRNKTPLKNPYGQEPFFLAFMG